MVTFVDYGASILSPVITLWNSFATVFPRIILAVIILIIGYFISLIIGHAVKVILEKLGLDAKVRKAKLTRAVGHTHLPGIFGEITKWYIFIIFLQVAVDKLNLGTLSTLLNIFVLWLPNLIAAVLIVLFGVAVGHYVEVKMTEHSKMKGIVSMSKVIKALIIIIMAIVAAQQISIKADLLENIITILVGGLALGIALAIGLGVGLGMKGDIAKSIKGLKKRF